MNNIIKTAVGVIAIIAVIGTIAITMLSKKDTAINDTTQSNTLKSSTQNTGTTTELSSDRGDGARGAQKKNRDASDLQNDLNSINP